MREYLAKPNETIEVHTNKLLSFFNDLLKLYGNHFTDEEINLIKLACTYHDKGKANELFQTKIRGNKYTIPGEIPHGVLSCAFIEPELKKTLGDENFQLLLQSVYNHHTRDIKFNDSEINSYIEQKLMPYLKTDYPDINLQAFQHSEGKLGEEYNNTDSYYIKYFLSIIDVENIIVLLFEGSIR